MTNWLPDPLSPKGPVYVAIADALSRDVASGRLVPGERLPTHRALARALGVNVVTVTRAYAEAARRGLIDGEVGRGTFVREEQSDMPLLHLAPHLAEPGRIEMHFNVQAIEREVLDPSEVLAEIAADPRYLPISNAYEPGGFLRHREAGAEWLSRTGVEADPERTLVTVGAQQGMLVAIASLTEPGDVLLAEEVAYTGVKAVARHLHLRVLPLRLDEEGVRPDSLEEACLKANPKVLYLNPTVHNPTGSVMSVARRQELAAIAQRHDLAIVEDDTQAYLVPDPPTPFASLVPERTYFLTTLSKSLLGGLRVGYLMAPRAVDQEAIRNRLMSTIAATVWMAPPLMAEIATRWIESGKADEVVRTKRAQALRRRAIHDRILGADATASHPASCFTWLPLGGDWRADDLANQARACGVGINSGEAFVVGRAPSPHAVRICLGAPPRDEDVERGLNVLANLLDRRPPMCEAVI